MLTNYIKSFGNFINEGEDTSYKLNEAAEAIKIGTSGVYLIDAKVSDVKLKNVDAKKFTFKLKVEHEGSGLVGKTIEDSFTLAMSADSTGVYKLGKDVEKFMGVPEKDVIRDVKSGKESEDNAIIYGMCNIMNGGKDIYFWTNGTRLIGETKKVGIMGTIVEQLSHEAGVHLTRLILTRYIAKEQGFDTKTDEWVTADYGAGEYSWPAIGDPNDKTPKIIYFDEETFATVGGAIVQMITAHFVTMASKYIPELVNYK